MDLDEIDHWKTYGGMKQFFTCEDGMPASLLIKDNIESLERKEIRVDRSQAIVIPFKVLSYQRTCFDQARFDVDTKYQEMRVMKKGGAQLSPRSN